MTSQFDGLQRGKSTLQATDFQLNLCWAQIITRMSATFAKADERSFIWQRPLNQIQQKAATGLLESLLLVFLNTDYRPKIDIIPVLE